MLGPESPDAVLAYYLGDDFRQYYRKLFCQPNFEQWVQTAKAAIDDVNKVEKNPKMRLCDESGKLRDDAFDWVRGRWHIRTHIQNRIYLDDAFLSDDRIGAYMEICNFAKDYS